MTRPGQQGCSLPAHREALEALARGERLAPGRHAELGACAQCAPLAAEWASTTDALEHWARVHRDEVRAIDEEATRADEALVERLMDGVMRTEPGAEAAPLVRGRRWALRAAAAAVLLLGGLGLARALWPESPAAPVFLGEREGAARSPWKVVERYDSFVWDATRSDSERFVVLIFAESDAALVHEESGLLEPELHFEPAFTRDWPEAIRWEVHLADRDGQLVRRLGWASASRSSP